MLLAEDNPGDVVLVRQALKVAQLNCELVVHSDGETMLRYIDRLDEGEVPCPDIVLLDLNLPKKDGEALLVRMRQSPFCAHVPVLIVTSSDSQKDRAMASNAGASGYFRKPNDYDGFMQLGSVVRALLT